MLVNYWYANPVGHAVEGLRYAFGYQVASPGAKVSLLLSDATAVELARCCPFLDAVYTVSYPFGKAGSDPRAALAHVPREWDWVIDNFRVQLTSHERTPGFKAFFDAAHEHFRPRKGLTLTGDEPPSYSADRQLRLELPDDAVAAARQRLGGRRAISAVLAGQSDSRASYPSTASWRLLLSRLSERYPEAAIVLIGKLRGDAKTSTTAMTRAEVDRLLADVPAAIDAFDIPLLEQLALVEASDLFVSPHTGFAFAALAVGTPWLALSGGVWHEYFFNGVPFHSLVPSPRKYPSFTPAATETVDDVDGEGPRIPSMTLGRFREDLPEFLDAAERLIARRISYEDALAAYFPRLADAYGGDTSCIFSFDNVHARYVAAPRVASTTARMVLPSESVVRRRLRRFVGTRLSLRSLRR